MPAQYSPDDVFSKYRVYSNDQRIGAGPNNIDNPDFNPFLGGYFGSDGIWRPYLSSIGTKQIIGEGNVPFLQGGPTVEMGGSSTPVPLQANPYFDYQVSDAGPTSMQYYDKSGNPIQSGGTPPLFDLYYGNKYLQGNWNNMNGTPTFSQTLAQNQQGSQNAPTSAQLMTGNRPATNPVPMMPNTSYVQPSQPPMRSTSMQGNIFTPNYQPLNIGKMYGASPAWNAVSGMR